jgi:hypothetical protein
MPESIKNAIYGTKGYGWYNDRYYAKHPVVVMDREQERTFFDAWLTSNYDALIKKYENSKEYNPDAMQDTVLYMYKEIAKPRGINNYFNQFNWKLKKMLIDHGRTLTNRRKFETNDVMSKDEDGKEVSYIDSMADKIADEQYECVNDLNHLLQTEAVCDYVYATYKEEGKVFIDYYKNYLTGKTKGGQKALAVKHGIALAKIHPILKKIKEDLVSNAETILQVYEVSKYKEFDEYGLEDF